MNATDLARIIDHTTLGPAVSSDGVARICAESIRFGFGCVCVPPVWVEHAADRLKGTGVRVGSVAGFPHGNSTTEVKCAEAAAALDAGASEVDMVAQVGWLIAGDLSGVARDIEAVRRVVRGGAGVLKVILEVALLDDDAIAAGCRCALEAGADFVKTSTGFAGGGATEHAVALMREAVGAGCGVKAAGGIRDYSTAMRMVNAGANRIGSSASAAILSGAPGGGEPDTEGAS